MKDFIFSAHQFPSSRLGSWLPDMDLNHDKQIQSLLCYRYTIGQTSASKVKPSRGESRLRANAYLKACDAPVPKGHPTIAQRFNVGTAAGRRISPEGTAEGIRSDFSRPSGTTAASRSAPNVETLGYYQTSLRDENEIPAGRACELLNACGLEIRDTADWKSALRASIHPEDAWSVQAVASLCSHTPNARD